MLELVDTPLDGVAPPALDALLTALGDPHSLSYRHFLTPTSTTSASHPPRSSTVQHASARTGRELEEGAGPDRHRQHRQHRQPADRDVTGIAEETAKAFGTSLSRYQDANGQHFFARDTDPVSRPRPPPPPLAHQPLRPVRVVSAAATHPPNWSRSTACPD
ncbi:hypothetical protein ACFPC0_09700 [Streptomyces andamanensis]|uniref:Uncharacterized protein n=1 Tax=Streptomyces andamanensis TaxID=1565035 RepID=A0ABV8TBY8_9ACTN